MILGVDHVVIAVADLAAGVAAYETLLARKAEPARESDGAASAFIRTGNAAVELMAPAGEGEAGRRLRAAIEESGEGLKSLVFAVDDVARMHRRAERVGLAPEDIKRRDGWASFRADKVCTHGARLFFLERETPLAVSDVAEAGAVGLDHLVIRAPDMERAAALYGARLGLDMRLDREVAGRRLMFFRAGDVIVEIAHRGEAKADEIWGLSWRVADADAARDRLAGAGFNVSLVRAGAKPGTRVFSVRDGACGVPTLMIETSDAA